jgi:hypothetical protein
MRDHMVWIASFSNSSSSSRQPAGPATIMARTLTGFCWAGLCNTRTQPSNEIDAALDQLLWNIIRHRPLTGHVPIKIHQTTHRGLPEFLGLFH